MKKITLQVDIDENEVFASEVAKCIEAEARRQVRNAMNEAISEEVARLVRSNLNGKVQSYVQEHLSNKVKAALAEVKIQEKDINRITDTEIKKIINHTVCARLDTMDIKRFGNMEDYFRSLISEEVEKQMPAILIALLKGQ